MKNQHDRFLDNLPSGWTFDRLKDVVALRNEKTSEATADEDYLELEDLESGTGRILNRRSTLEVESAVTVFKKGDILFGKLRPYLEKYCEADFDGKCTGEILAFKPERLASRFLFYCVGSRWFIQRCNALAYGAKIRASVGQPNYRNSTFHSQRCPNKSRFAAYLDASCAAIDAAVAAKRQQIGTLDGVRRDVVQSAVTRGLEDRPALKSTGNVWFSEMPSNWELVSLKRVSEMQTGLTLGKVYEGPFIERPYLRVANVQDGHLTLEDVTTIDVPEAVARRVELCTGDVLMTEGGDLDKLGRGTIWRGQIRGCLHQNHIFAIRCIKHKLLPEFLAYLTASRYGRDYFEATGKRTTNLASTNSTKVGMFPIPRPSIAEQRAICRFLDQRLEQLSRVVSGIEAQIHALTAYRKSLIHECRPAARD
ncbi:MAG: hypothetical protein ACREX9_04450 [Gammaproteobacteria bacterium]